MENSHSTFRETETLFYPQMKSLLLVKCVQTALCMCVFLLLKQYSSSLSLTSDFSELLQLPYTGLTNAQFTLPLVFLKAHGVAKKEREKNKY